MLAKVLDHARVQPNPVRDPLVKLPRGERKEVNPPTAEHILAVHALMPSRYKLPLLVLDATGMRIGELERLDLGRRRRAARALARLSGCLQVGHREMGQPPAELFEAVTGLVAREDRTPSARLPGVRRRQVPTAITRACTAVGRPHLQPARPPAPPRLPAPPRRDAVGADRRDGRSRRRGHDGPDVHARRGVRGRARLREPASETLDLRFADRDVDRERLRGIVDVEFDHVRAFVLGLELENDRNHRASEPARSRHLTADRDLARGLG